MKWHSIAERHHLRESARECPLSSETSHTRDNKGDVALSRRQTNYELLRQRVSTCQPQIQNTVYHRFNFHPFTLVALLPNLRYKTTPSKSKPFPPSQLFTPIYSLPFSPISFPYLDLWTTTISNHTTPVCPSYSNLCIFFSY